MPKIIELTFELSINKVTCPGVWLCQDGHVSLAVYALGANYETCMVPPIFPLMFKDLFYFRKRFQPSCTLSNIFCLLKDETVYCELIQWGGNCRSGKCSILAQYLGALNDVLFPPDLCSNEGVDLLMRRARGFPGILAPKIEISTKVRLDEVYDQVNSLPPSAPRMKPCSCRKNGEVARQKQVCHTPVYHRRRHRRPHSTGSCCSEPKEPECGNDCVPPPACAVSRSRTSLSDKHKEFYREYQSYQVYNVATPILESTWQDASKYCSTEDVANSDLRTSQDKLTEKSTRMPKVLLESRFIEPEPPHRDPLTNPKVHRKITNCTCDICKRYFALFYQNTMS